MRSCKPTGQVLVVGGGARAAARDVRRDVVDFVAVFLRDVMRGRASVGRQHDSVSASHAHDGGSRLGEVRLHFVGGNEARVARRVLEVESSFIKLFHVVHRLALFINCCIELIITFHPPKCCTSFLIIVFW